MHLRRGRRDSELNHALEGMRFGAIQLRLMVAQKLLLFLGGANWRACRSPPFRAFLENLGKAFSAGFQI